MMIALHKNARTTLAIRTEIAVSTHSAVVLARRYGISGQYVGYVTSNALPSSIGIYPLFDIL
jgi:hypothetical protein